jgi:hypothetical protein
MPKYKFTIESLAVPSDGGQGALEGPMEVRIAGYVAANGQELGKEYPVSAGDTVTLKPGGDAKLINAVLGELVEKSAGDVFRTVSLQAEENDGGLNGKNDTGSASLLFVLNGDMQPSRKTATILLHRPHMKNPLGKVRATVAVERIS